MNINVISDYKTAGAASATDNSAPLQDVKTEEVKNTKEAQVPPAGAVYTEGTDKNAPVYEDKEEAAEDTVYKQEEAAGGDVSNTSSQITESDYIALEQEGISLEKFELERLDRMLSRIKQQRDLQDESITEQRTKLTEKVLQQQFLALDYTKNKHLIERLDSANIPITKANIERIATGADKAKSVENMSDQAKYYLVKNRMEPTLDNIYKASYSAAHVKETPVNDSQWESIRPQAEKIIEDSGFEVNEQSLSNARWLYSILPHLVSWRKVKGIEQPGQTWTLAMILFELWCPSAQIKKWTTCLSGICISSRGNKKMKIEILIQMLKPS
ncbi:MAG: hypothetical protein K0R05_3190 [Anaerocolumna sp.]|nr:hypothetical protein [Anaerocolumna sp.]